jgi:hypothetical protein
MKERKLKRKIVLLKAKAGIEICVSIINLLYMFYTKFTTVNIEVHQQMVLGFQIEIFIISI